MNYCFTEIIVTHSTQRFKFNISSENIYFSIKEIIFRHVLKLFALFTISIFSNQSLVMNQDIYCRSINLFAFYFANFAILLKSAKLNAQQN